jgi:hypothetical protein
MPNPERCKCLIWHPHTQEERDLVKERLDYSREVGDRHGIMINVIALTGDCPAREKKS